MTKNSRTTNQIKSTMEDVDSIKESKSGSSDKNSKIESSDKTIKENEIKVSKILNDTKCVFFLSTKFSKV